MEVLSKYQGIQPVAKSSFGVFDWFGWSLPGKGQPYADCGKTLVFGCLNVEAHNQSRLDGVDVVGKAFVKLKRRTCLRAVCPTCYEKWAGKEAHKIGYRLDQWHGSGQVIHVIISVPERLYCVPMENLRSKIYDVARKVGLFGGSVIPHPYRERCKICGSLKDSLTKQCENCGCSEFNWVVSPHFHLLGYGWIHGDRVSEIYKKEGWIIKNIGIRVSVESTALYQLSHAGVHEKYHTVTWFGRLAYNKLRVKPEVVEKDKCPICDSELVRLVWDGEGECPFENEGDYFDKATNWREKGFVGWRCPS
jgi:hypothetical protein